MERYEKSLIESSIKNYASKSEKQKQKDLEYLKTEVSNFGTSPKTDRIKGMLVLIHLMENNLSFEEDAVVAYYNNIKY